MSEFTEIKLVRSFFNSTKDKVQKIAFTLCVLVVAWLIDTAIVYTVTDHQGYVIFLWGVIGTAWVVEYGNTHERMGSRERYLEWMSNIDVSTLTRMASSPELDRESKLCIISYLNKNKVGWSLDNQLNGNKNPLVASKE